MGRELLAVLAGAARGAVERCAVPCFELCGAWRAARLGRSAWGALFFVLAALVFLRAAITAVC